MSSGSFWPRCARAPRSIKHPVYLVPQRNHPAGPETVLSRWNLGVGHVSHHEKTKRTPSLPVGCGSSMGLLADCMLHQREKKTFLCDSPTTPRCRFFDVLFVSALKTNPESPPLTLSPFTVSSHFFLLVEAPPPCGKEPQLHRVAMTLPRSHSRCVVDQARVNCDLKGLSPPVNLFNSVFQSCESYLNSQ